MPILEVISTSPFDSLNIQKAGANRIQLVSALQIGGLTPSATVIRKSLQCVDIPTMVMIRHHNNGFINSKDQIQLLCEQARYCVQMGVKGIVLGGINQKKQLDEYLIEEIKKLINLSKIDTTFHKAFDQVGSIVQQYQKLTNSHINRVLTQGGQQDILKNLHVLGELVEKSKQTYKVKVLLGGGITFQNARLILNETKAQQLHIGTCVRKNKYGPVDFEKVEQFLKLIN